MKMAQKAHVVRNIMKPYKGSKACEQVSPEAQVNLLVPLRSLELKIYYSVNHIGSSGVQSSSPFYYNYSPTNNLMPASSFFRCFVPEEEKDPGVESPLFC